MHCVCWVSRWPTCTPMMLGPSPLAGSFRGMVSGGLNNYYSGGRVVWYQDAPVPGMVYQCRTWCTCFHPLRVVCVHQLEAMFSLGLGEGLVPRVDYTGQDWKTSFSSSCPGFRECWDGSALGPLSHGCLFFRPLPRSGCVQLCSILWGVSAGLAQCS